MGCREGGEDSLQDLKVRLDPLEDNQLIQLRLINELRRKPEEDSPLFDELYKEMKALGRKQTDFAIAARMTFHGSIEAEDYVLLGHFMLNPPPGCASAGQVSRGQSLLQSPARET